MQASKVDILLATYNGANFLKIQLESIVNQSHTNWKLLIRDDGSTDDTVSIIQLYCQKYPEKMIWINDGKGNVGPKTNFSILMENSNSDYIFFADQDDFWLPQKIEITLKKIIAIENNQKEIPCFVFSDLSMADENLNIVAHSLWKKDKLNPKRVALGNLLMQNVPYGCAMAVNKTLLNIGTPISSKAILHDHWLVLLAAATGRISHLDEPTILHRIHTNNASRAADPLKKEIDNNVEAIVSNKNLNVYLGKLQEQAKGVKERLNEHKIGQDAISTLEAFINLKNQSIFVRKYNFIKYRFFKNQILQTIKWLIRI